ncbi:hypothetical protein BABINDRAFT_160735 [Babjeviella inositovora NRRL Y-12698]|uniref:Cation efflux protein cytoplasmic domain-containing protein n=1 Tax=Babjeviella inositovora NRRL Y-12698 TaxID=984486 RepID=A0A1E3QUM6_9ASCO|nr:uncharacterized protein BABINDRAFT_160735 [Babjeviella inositovora NRRL Y-12698]ODQ81395.1 hypothetical protein BABINDRAFT_160735 [Babjeviella inositovora NRRL Y-12698]
MKGKEIRIVTLLVIDTFFFFLEAIIGYSVNSLALIADSFHMLNDIISLIIALWAVNVSKSRGPDAKYTYGWQRAEILGALMNAVFLLALCFTIFIEVIQRFISPPEITNPKLILVVGTAGLISNIVGLFLFHDSGHSHSHGGLSGGHSHGHDAESLESPDGSSVADIMPQAVVAKVLDEHSALLSEHEHGHSHSHGSSHDSEPAPAKPKKKKSLNMEGVFLHVLGDALGNVGVIVTAIFIWKTDYTWKFYSDPLVSLFITIIIFSSALPLCKATSRILLQASPSHISADKIIERILRIDGIVSVHDFHLWMLNESKTIASLHVELESGNAYSSPASFMDITKQIRTLLHEYGIHTATVQPEYNDALVQQVIGISSNPSRENSTSNLGVYGSTNQESCFIDNAAGCDPRSCIPE